MRYSGVGADEMIEPSVFKKRVDDTAFTVLFTSCLFTFCVWILVMVTLVFVVKVL